MMFEMIANYKGLIIGLILNTGDVMRVETHDLSCAEWWDRNVITHERKIYLRRENMYFHTYKGEIVVGYHCSDKEPK